MAIPYVTGPGHVYVGIGAGRAPVFLGHAENGFKITRRQAFEPVMADVGGRKIPIDVIYQGSEYFVSGDLTRFNSLVWHSIETQPTSSLRGTLTGDLNLAGEIGTLMLHEGYTYDLWLQFPFAAKPFYAANFMVPGYHWLNAYLIGPDEQDTGTVNQKIRVVWNCIPGYTPAGARKAMDHDMSRIPVSPPN